MVSERQARKLKDKQKHIAAFDAFESSMEYFKMLIDKPDVDELCERLQEKLLAHRVVAMQEFHEEYDRIFPEGDGVNSPDSAKEP